MTRYNGQNHRSLCRRRRSGLDGFHPGRVMPSHPGAPDAFPVEARGAGAATRDRAVAEQPARQEAKPW